MNSNTRIAATVFPKDTYCLRNISADTLHKGDIDYDDDDRNNNKINDKKLQQHNRLKSLLSIVLTLC
jgi:hypothetical protein